MQSLECQDVGREVVARVAQDVGRLAVCKTQPLPVVDIADILARQSGPSIVKPTVIV